MLGWITKAPAVIALLVACATSGVACAPGEQETPDSSADAIRSPRAGLDVDVLVLDEIPVGSSPPADLATVASWSVRYVQLRDPATPSKPDPDHPFNGFFLVAKDASGRPLFFDAMSFAADGIVHCWFSTSTDELGRSLELPLVALTDDAAAKARAEATVSWLASERTHLADVLRETFAAPALVSQSRSLARLGSRERLTALKCVADLAVLGLTVTSPLTFFLVQAGVDGTFAVLETLTEGDQAGELATSAAMNATLGGVVSGTGRAVRAAVARGSVQQATIARLRTGGAAALGAGVVSAIGYQAYREGARGALATAIDVIVPASCQRAYENLSRPSSPDPTAR